MPTAFYQRTLSHADLLIDARLSGIRYMYERLFDEYMRSAEATEALASEFNAGVKRDRSFDTEFDIPEEYARVCAAEKAVELSAQTLILMLDDFLSKIRFSLTGFDACRDDGPELRNGVTIDRALDAAGNYVRHSHEWFAHDWKSTWPQGQQLTSIRAIARLFAPYPIENEQEAYIAFTRVSYPMISLLDLLSDYEKNGNDSRYAIVEVKVREAAIASVRRAALPEAVTFRSKRK